MLGVSDRFVAVSVTHNNLFEEKAEWEAFGRGQGGRCDSRAHCLWREERAKLQAASSRRGVKAAFGVQ